MFAGEGVARGQGVSPEPVVNQMIGVCFSMTNALLTGRVRYESTSSVEKHWEVWHHRRTNDL